MSQKSGKRSRRLTTDSDNTSQFKLPSTKNVINENEQQIEETTNINGDNDAITTTIETTERVTRSRSNTPQIKQMINGKEENDKQMIVEQSTAPLVQQQQQQEVIVIEEIEVTTEEKTNDDKEACEMDPLVLLDEPDPELVFDENSDYDNGSGKASPILNRCVTRRSQTRNIPTPKTPPQQKEQIIEEKDEENEEDEEEQEQPPSSGGGGGGGGGGDSTFETCDNLSTKAEIGSDTTRFNYLINNETITTTSEPSSFLLESKDRSFTETLRNLSTRRSLRPFNNDYRRRIFNRIDKNDLNSTAPSIYPSRNDSVERVSVSGGGSKRKIDDNDTSISSLKRFKLDTSGIWTKLTSPLTNFQNSFINKQQSSTPKLTGYKDEKFFVENDNNVANEEQQTVDKNEERWCIIM